MYYISRILFAVLVYFTSLLACALIAARCSLRRSVALAIGVACSITGAYVLVNVSLSLWTAGAAKLAIGCGVGFLLCGLGVPRRILNRFSERKEPTR